MDTSGELQKCGVVDGACFTNICHRNVSVVGKSCGKSKNDRSTCVNEAEQVKYTEPRPTSV